MNPRYFSQVIGGSGAHKFNQISADKENSSHTNCLVCEKNTKKQLSGAVSGAHTLSANLFVRQNKNDLQLWSTLSKNKRHAHLLNRDLKT